jgi:ubiquinone/menaquinone biosynthesis C-methylase UbiE
MVHKDHVALIQDGIGEPGGTWADLGSGTGAFTLALRDVGGEAIKIHSVDQDAESLAKQKQHFAQMFPGSNITYVHQSFLKPLQLPQLDGILMANALHYVEDQITFLKEVKKHLKPHGKLILVEYNSDEGNQWVPYPVPFSLFSKLASQTGFTPPSILGKIPSQFLHEIYSAVSYKG